MKANFAATLILTLSVAAACGDDDDAGEAGELQDQTTEARETAEDGRRRGGEITVAVGTFTMIDPHALGASIDVTVARMLWRGLYSLTADGRLTDEQNLIADGPPEISEDGTLVTVRLRPGLRWSDGDDLRAEDFVAGVVRSCNPLVQSGGQYLLSNIRGCDDFYFSDPTSADLVALQAAVGVRAVDVLTIEFTLNQPQPSFPSALVQPAAFPVPVHLARFAAATPQAPGDWGVDPSQLAYNGPYVLSEYTELQAVFEPNPQWSGSVQPSLDRVVFRLEAEDPAAAVDAYRNGEVQVVRVQADQLIDAVAEFGGEYFQETRTTTRALQMNLANETLANIDVRLALARAIDREALNAEVANGGFVPTTAWLPEVTSGLPPDSYEEVIGFDPEAAREHLAAAGYPDGQDFPRLRLMAITDLPTTEFEDAAAFLDRQFQEVLNIDVDVELLEDVSFFERLNALDFDLYLLGWVQDYPDPENWILGLFDTDGIYNYPGCSDPDIDALIEEARFNPNDEERREQYRRIERLVIERVCGVIPLMNLGISFLIDPELAGFREHASPRNDAQLPGEGVPEAWGLRGE